MRDGFGHSLIGEELSGVGFVRDYIELYFDGPIFTMFGEVSFRSPQPSAAPSLESQLRSLIGSTVTGIRDSTNFFEMEFSGGFRVGVRPGANLGEYAQLVTYPDNRLVIWQIE